MKKSLTIIGIVALVAVLCVCLMACIPNDYSKAEKNLKDADYTVASYKKGDFGFNTATSMFGVENIEAFVSGIKGEDSIVLIYFDSSKSAKNAFDKLKEDFADDKDKKDMTVKCSGKVIYAGTDAAIKAVK